MSFYNIIIRILRRIIDIVSYMVPFLNTIVICSIIFTLYVYVFQDVEVITVYEGRRHRPQVTPMTYFGASFIAATASVSLTCLVLTIRDLIAERSPIDEKIHREIIDENSVYFPNGIREDNPVVYDKAYFSKMTRLSNLDDEFSLVKVRQAQINQKYVNSDIYKAKMERAKYGVRRRYFSTDSRRDAYSEFINTKPAFRTRVMFDNLSEEEKRKASLTDKSAYIMMRWSADFPTSNYTTYNSIITYCSRINAFARWLDKTKKEYANINTAPEWLTDVGGSESFIDNFSQASIEYKMLVKQHNSEREEASAEFKRKIDLATNKFSDRVDSLVRHNPLLGIDKISINSLPEKISTDLILKGSDFDSEEMQKALNDYKRDLWSKHISGEITIDELISILKDLRMN